MCQGWGHGGEDLPTKGKTEARCSRVWEVQLRGESRQPCDPVHSCLLSCPLKA